MFGARDALLAMLALTQTQTGGYGSGGVRPLAWSPESRPEPRFGETRDEFLGRCMLEAKHEIGLEERRTYCRRQWRLHGGRGLRRTTK